MGPPAGMVDESVRVRAKDRRRGGLNFFNIFLELLKKGGEPSSTSATDYFFIYFNKVVVVTQLLPRSQAIK